MLSDIENVRRLTELLSDEGFIDALSNTEELVDDVDERLERVEQLEEDAEEAVREANDALNAVDHRLQKFDEAIRLIEAKIEAGFSAGFFFFAYQQWSTGAVFIATGLFLMGLLGSSSLVVTITNMPQVERLRQMGTYLISQLRETESGGPAVEIETADEQPGGDDGRGSDDETGPRIDWQTTADREDDDPETRRHDRGGENSEAEGDGSRRGRKADDSEEGGSSSRRGS